MLDIQGIRGELARLGWVGFRSFITTLVGGVLVGIVLGSVSYYFLREYTWFYGLASAALALIESILVAVVLGTKRAVILTAAQAIASLRIGRVLVSLLFDRMLTLVQTPAPADRDAIVVNDRMPQVEADKLVARAADDVIGRADERGWLLQKIQSWLVDAVARLTLTRFREEAADNGYVDLLQARADLQQDVDNALANLVRQRLNRLTILAVVGLPAVIALHTWLFVLLAQAER